MNITDVFNKLRNGKAITRPSFPSGVYLFIPPNMNYIYTFYPSNSGNPALQYSPTIADINATDWMQL